MPFMHILSTAAQWCNALSHAHSPPLYRKCESSAQVQSWAGHVSPPSWPSAALCGRANGKQPYGCGKVTRAYDYVFKTVHMARYKFAYFTLQSGRLHQNTDELVGDKPVGGRKAGGPVLWLRGLFVMVRVQLSNGQHVIKLSCLCNNKSQPRSTPV